MSLGFSSKLRQFRDMFRGRKEIYPPRFSANDTGVIQYEKRKRGVTYRLEEGHIMLRNMTELSYTAPPNTTLIQIFGPVGQLNRSSAGSMCYADLDPPPPWWKNTSFPNPLQRRRSMVSIARCSYSQSIRAYRLQSEWGLWDLIRHVSSAASPAIHSISGCMGSSSAYNQVTTPLQTSPPSTLGVMAAASKRARELRVRSQSTGQTSLLEWWWVWGKPSC